jgi:hypothetical protein
MDRQYIRDQQVIERYLAGTLAPEEEAAFEEAYLGDTALLEELQAAERLKEALRGRAAVPGGAAGQARRRWLGSPAYAVAASWVAGVALVATAFLYFDNRSLRGAAGITGVELVPILAVRGAEPQAIESRGGAGSTVLLLDPGFGVYESFAVVLTRTDGATSAPLFAVEGLTPSYEGMLAVSVPRVLLPAGTYEVQLLGRRADWPADRAADDLGRTAFTVSTPN